MNVLEIVKKVPNLVTKNGGRTALIIKKYSPEILTGAGIVGGIVSGVMACKATLKVESVLDKHEETMNNIHKAETLDVEGRLVEGKSYTSDDARKDKAICYGRTALEFVKLYGPSVALGTASIGCILGGHGILNKRNAAIAAAYSVVQDRLNDYRQRVVEEFGEDKDKEFFHGTKSETVTITEEDETGKKKKVKKKVNRITDPNGYSQYAKCFDEASPNWVKTPEYNLLFLKNQQNYANDLLHSRGHIFLNEIYDMLGIPRTQEGAVVGWVLSEDSDNFVDFGMYNADNQAAMDFINGYENCIMLDFNVDGVIFDLI